MTLDMTVWDIDFMTAVLFLEDLIHPVLRQTKLAVQQCRHLRREHQELMTQQAREIAWSGICETTLPRAQSCS